MSERPPSLATAQRLTLEELVAVAAALAAIAAFYLRWPVWEDQGVYDYMAWGALHGKRLYVDLIDMNWPGIVIVHLVARVIGGGASWGLRLVDLGGMLAIAGMTLWLLGRWGVPRTIRVAAVVCYLTNYLAAGYQQTAERESFALPLALAGMLPWLVTASIKKRADVIGFALAGAAAGMAVWIKPPIAALIAASMILPVLTLPWRATGKTMAAWVGGALVVTLGFVVALAAMKSLAGFWHWSIDYAFTAYAKTVWPWRRRLFYVLWFVVYPRQRPLPVLMILLGAVGIGAGAWIGSRECASRHWRAYRSRILACAILVAAALLAALLQGKTHCNYHFIPLRWATSALGAVLLAAVPVDWGRWAGWVVGGACAIILLWTVETGFAGIRMPLLRPDAVAAIRAVLGRDGQFVAWTQGGLLQATLERSTPFPLVAAHFDWVCTPPGRWRDQMMQMLCTALKDPSVKLLMVQHTNRFAICWPPQSAQDVIAADADVQRVLRSEYRGPYELDDYDAYVRGRIKPAGGE